MHQNRTLITREQTKNIGNTSNDVSSITFDEIRWRISEFFLEEEFFIVEILLQKLKSTQTRYPLHQSLFLINVNKTVLGEKTCNSFEAQKCVSESIAYLFVVII